MPAVEVADAAPVGKRSVFDRTRATVGQAASAWRRKSDLGCRELALDASETRITASAVGRAREGAGRVARGQATDAWRVDEDQALLKDRPRQQGLGADDVRPSARSTRPPMERRRWSIATSTSSGSASPPSTRCGPRGEQDGARGLRARSAPPSAPRGRDVVVYRAYRGIDQGVDELALALLELSHDEDADRGIRESPGRMPQPRPRGQHAPAAAQGPRALYQVRCCLAHVSLLDGCQPLQHRESIVGPSRRADSEITAPRTTPARSGRTHEPGGDAPPVRGAPQWRAVRPKS
jgi:hypothetical protein